MYIDPVFSRRQRWIWTGDKLEGEDEDGSEAAWFVNFSHGDVDREDFSSYSFCVRPVRSDLSNDSGEELEEEDHDTIESYKQAIRINPDDAFAHFNLGLAYFLLNDRDSAMEQYKILKKLDTEMASKLFNEIYE